MSSRPPARPSSLARGLAAALPAVVVSVSLAVSLPALSAPEPATPFAVATESPAATRQASRLLEAGGNAVDAAILAALVAGFANPSSSGIGGGGFALVWSARDQRASIVDFRETAPAGVDTAILDKRPIAEAQSGHTVGVPGEVAGLFELHQRFGKSKWQDIVSRAALLAERGFPTESHTAEQVGEQKAPSLLRSLSYRSTYLPAGTAPKLGQTLRAPKLAKTLRRIALEGKRGFYEGPVARDIVSAVAAAGGALKLSDLAGYQPVSREPLRASWEGKEVLAMPPPSAGGLLVLQTLALFSRAELLAMNAAPAKRIHLLAEAMRAASADRARYLSDPAFTAVDTAKLLSPARMARRKQRLAEERTHSQPRFGLEESGTHHLVTADREGNWVSLCTTVNGPFGAKLIAEQSGVILNNELTDFSTSESVAVFGVTQNPNRARAGARPVSSMSPVLVLERGAPMLALGGSGGLAIGPNVTQVLLNRLAFELDAGAAVTAPRFTIPSLRTGQTLWLEAALSKQHASDLERRGELLLSKDSSSAVQLVAREADKLVAASDPRKGGTAEARNPTAAAQ